MDREFLTVAIEAAQKGGKVLRDFWEKGFDVQAKGPLDFVTDADHESERVIKQEIEKAFPDHGFIGEECGFLGDIDQEYVWIVDPLDGTTNYIHHYGEVAISIALLQKGEPIVGVIYNPVRDELFSAVKGEGASLNGKPIKVSKAPSLEDSLLVSGFFGGREGAVEDNSSVMRALKGKAHGLRISGSAALNLAGVAAGYFDGCWYQGLKVWDLAAGILLIREAGGEVTALGGGKIDLLSGQLLATNGSIHQELKTQLDLTMDQAGI